VRPSHLVQELTDAGVQRQSFMLPRSGGRCLGRQQSMHLQLEIEVLTA